MLNLLTTKNPKANISPLINMVRYNVSLDLNSGELRLIEVKGIGEVTGTILLTPNERRVAEDRRIATGSTSSPIVARSASSKNPSKTLPGSRGMK